MNLASTILLCLQQPSAVGPPQACKGLFRCLCCKNGGGERLPAARLLNHLRYYHAPDLIEVVKNKINYNFMKIWNLFFKSVCNLIYLLILLLRLIQLLNFTYESATNMQFFNLDNYLVQPVSKSKVLIRFEHLYRLHFSNGHAWPNLKLCRRAKSTRKEKYYMFRILFLIIIKVIPT